MGMTYRIPPLFRVKYKFLSREEGGRTSPPKQGWRAAFQYTGRPLRPYHEVWPLFENETGETLTELADVPVEGTAQMFVVHAEELDFHRRMAQPGVACLFLEGNRAVAHATVIGPCA
jgi:hypothetical protein